MAQELDGEIAHKKSHLDQLTNENNLDYTAIKFTDDRKPHPELNYLMVTGPIVSWFRFLLECMLPANRKFPSPCLHFRLKKMCIRNLIMGATRMIMM